MENNTEGKSKRGEETLYCLLIYFAILKKNINLNFIMRYIQRWQTHRCEANVVKREGDRAWEEGKQQDGGEQKSALRLYK